MRKRAHLPAFTIIELLVGITIIGILALGIANTNFSRLSQKQQISVESIKIVNLIEEARNNALIGKGVGVDLVTPDSWSVNINHNSSSGSVDVQYYSGGLLLYNNWDTPFGFEITNLECRNLDDTLNTSSGSFILTFTGSIGGIQDCTGKKITFSYGKDTLTQNITINALSGVIEVN